jgi:phosphoglycolate phosphatase
MTGKISALIFDFDGTLIDSKKDVFKSLMHAFSVCGIPINPPDAAIIMQKQLSDAIQYAVPDISTEKRAAISEAYKKHYDASEYPNTTLMPGARDLLETCARRSIPCFIVSNKRQFPVLRIIESFNLRGYFAAIYNPDTFDGKFFSKSQLLAYALKEQRLNRRTTAYIGDMEADILTARENGMISIAVTNGYGADAAKATSPDFVVKDLSEMLGIISSGQK